MESVHLSLYKHKANSWVLLKKVLSLRFSQYKCKYQYNSDNTTCPKSVHKGVL